MAAVDVVESYLAAEAAIAAREHAASLDAPTPSGPARAGAWPG